MRDYFDSNEYVFLMDATETFLLNFFLTVKSQFHLGYMYIYLYEYIYIYI